MPPTMLDCQLVLYYLRYYRMCNIIKISIFYFLNITVIATQDPVFQTIQLCAVCFLAFIVICSCRRLKITLYSANASCQQLYYKDASQYAKAVRHTVPPVQPSVQFPALLLRTHPTSEPVGSSELYGWRIYCLCCPSVRLSEYPVRADKIE